LVTELYLSLLSKILSFRLRDHLYFTFVLKFEITLSSWEGKYMSS
jgi:hypothetical protein